LLEELHINDNELTSLPSEIGRLENLKTLNMEDNKFKTLPYEIGQLENLRNLNIFNDNDKKIKVSTNLKNFFKTKMNEHYHDDIFEFVVDKVEKKNKNKKDTKDTKLVKKEPKKECPKGKVVNPITGMYITIGKATYKKLVKEGIIK